MAEPRDRPKLLVLGGTGMLGHVLWRTCAERFDAHATVRRDRLEGPAARVLDPDRTITDVSAEDPRSVGLAIAETGAGVVVNCIGVVKQRPAGGDPAETVWVNALFPHQLAAICREHGARLIHISTDCVFSGAAGGYSERDTPDPVELYGRSKLLGEPSGDRVLTLRTSMIGRELERSHGLLEWFLSHETGSVKGFTRAMFSGPTAPVLSRLIADLAEKHPALEGTWHVGAAAISKYELLVLLRDAFDLAGEIVADDSLTIDRSLDSTRLRAATGWSAPEWPEMVAELSASRESSETERDLARR